MSILTELLIKISAKPDASLNTSLRDAKEEVKKLTGELTDLADKASIGFGLVALGAGALVKSWTDAAGQMEQYRAKLTTVLKSQTDASAALSKAVDFAGKTPFDVTGIVDATVQLEVYGVKAEQWLPKVGDLAAGMGRSIEETALTMGKALSGSLEGFESLRNTYGISSMELKKYGAVMGETGGISIKTAEDLQKAQDALAKIIGMKFGGGMERQMNTFQGAITNLQDEIKKLQVALGQELVPTITKVAQGVTGVTKAFNEYGGALKPLIAWGTLLAGAIAGVLVPLGVIIRTVPGAIATWTLLNTVMGAGILVTNASNFSFATNTAQMRLNQMVMAGYSPVIARTIISFQSLAAAMTPIVLIPAAIAAAFVIMTNKMQAENKKQEEILQRAEKQAAAARDIKSYEGQDVNKLRQMGVTAKDMEEKIRTLAQAITDAAVSGDKMLHKYYEMRRDQAEKLIEELKKVEQSYINVNQAFKDIKVNMDIISSVNAFKNPSEKLAFFTNQIIEAQNELRKFNKGDITWQNIGGVSDIQNLSKDMYGAEQRLTSIMKTKAQYDKIVDDIDAKEKRKEELSLYEKALRDQSKAISNALAVIIEAWQNAIGAVKDVKAKDLEDSKTYIDRQKELNQMSIDDEIKANERILSTMKKGTEEYTEQAHKIEVLKRDKSVKSAEQTEKDCKRELDAVKMMATGQVKEYDRLIKKIEELEKAGKMQGKQAHPLLEGAKKDRYEASKKEEEKLYKDMVDYQEHYLKQIDNNEQMSVEDRIGYYDSLEKFWYEMERQRVVITDQAEDQIMKIIEKRGALEKKIIENNKAAEQDLINMRKSALDGDIKRLQDKMKSGQDVEKELMRKMDDRMKLEMKAIETKDKELKKQNVSENKRTEIGARSQAALYEKQAEDIGNMISELQSKLPEEQDRLTQMSMESLISRLREKKSGLESSYRAATGQAEAAQAAGAIEPMPEVKTGFELPVQSFSTAVGQFSQVIDQFLQAFNRGVKNGVTIPDAINPIVMTRTIGKTTEQNQVQAGKALSEKDIAARNFYESLAKKLNENGPEMRTSASAINAIFNIDGIGITGGGEVKSAADNLAQAALKMMTNSGHLNNISLPAIEGMSY